MAKCVICKEDIQEGALKCVHCSSSQGWARHIPFSSTVLALLVALFSVLQTTIAMFVSMSAKLESVTSISLASVSDSEFSLVASNDGNKSSIVSFANLHMSSGDDDFFAKNYFIEQLGTSSNLIPAGETIQISSILENSSLVEATLLVFKGS